MKFEEEGTIVLSLTCIGVLGDRVGLKGPLGLGGIGRKNRRDSIKSNGLVLKGEKKLAESKNSFSGKLAWSEKDERRRRKGEEKFLRISNEWFSKTRKRGMGKKRGGKSSLIFDIRTGRVQEGKRGPEHPLPGGDKRRVRIGTLACKTARESRLAT